MQAELRAKTGSPSLGPTHMPHMAQPPTVQRAIMNRHSQNRRSTIGLPPKLEPGSATHSQVSVQSTQSPQSRPTPSSHASSPTSMSSGFQGVMTPPASEPQMQHQARPMKQQMNHGMSLSVGSLGAPLVPATKNHGSGRTGSIAGIQTGYYQAPFQNQIEQLGKLSRPLLSLISFYRTMFVLD